MLNIIEILEQDKLFATLFDSIPLGILIVDENQRVVKVNRFMKEQFQPSVVDRLQKSIGEVIQCFNEVKSPGVCGRGEQCQNCQILRPALSALQGDTIQRGKTELELLTGGDNFNKKELIVTAAPLEYEAGKCAIVIFQDVTELSNLRRQLTKQQKRSKFIGVDQQIIDLKEKIKELAEVDVPVLIQGESGTGKELVANEIHELGHRKNKPFIAVNCGALPENLLESELFGYIKGAFTGAIRDKKGRFELADGGTIFLDEIGDLSPAMQVKLLRVLQEGTFERLGSENTIKVNVRILSASNKDINEEIAAGRFREDLYYRLCVVPIFIPPLRERRKDIPLLVNHLLNHTANELGRGSIVISDEALQAMMDYHWPGNVRELQNAIQYSLVLCKGQTMEPNHLPPGIKYNRSLNNKSQRKERSRKIDTEQVKAILKKTGGNKVEAAQLLGVSRSTLYRFIEDKNLND